MSSYKLDNMIVYKITNISNNRWFIRNGYIQKVFANKDGKKVVVTKILVITIPQFEKPFFVTGDIVQVNEFGRKTDKKTIRIFEASAKD